MSPLTGRSSVVFKWGTADGFPTTPAGGSTCTVCRTVLKSVYTLITVVDIPTSLLEGLETEEPHPHSESALQPAPGIVYSVPMSWRVEIISGGDVIHS